LIRGIAWMKLRKFNRTIEDYKRSDQLYKNYHKVKCNLAWVYVSEPSILNNNLRKEALILARDAVNLYNHDLTLNVYACALAENKDFVSAIKILEMAINKAPEIRKRVYRNLLNAFKKGKTYIQTLI
jgi:tetratricopeptide (TPR) repeat protein